MSGEPAAAAEAPGTGSKPELRASHEDRDQVVEILRVAAGDGRLTAAELDERLEAALTARTHSDLAKLTADLPAAGLQGGIPQRARELVRIDHMGGNVKRVGRWVVPQRMEIHSVGGNVKLDFTDAVITQPRCGSRRRVPAGSPCRDRRRLDAAFALCHAFDAPIAACTRRSGRDGVAGVGADSGDLCMPADPARPRWPGRIEPGDRRGRGEPERRGEHRDRPQDRVLPRIQQPVTPLQRVLQRSVPLLPRAAGATRAAAAGRG